MFLTKKYFQAWMEHLVSTQFSSIKERLDQIMADVSPTLNRVANGLNELGPSLRAVLKENADLKKRNAELEEEDVAETTAAQDVENAFNNLAGAMNEDKSVPDVNALNV